MDLQLFYRDTEQVDNWMSKQEVCVVVFFLFFFFLKTLLFLIDFQFLQ